MLLEPLHDRIWHATIHRLRGIHAVLGGWAMLGAPHEDQPQLEARLAEDRLLLERLGWLRDAEREGTIDALAAPEHAAAALHAALHGETPEESSQPYTAVDGRAAVAIASWGAAMPKEGRLDAPPPRLHGDAGTLELAHEPSRQPAAGWCELWNRHFGGLVLHAGERGVRVRSEGGLPALLGRGEASVGG